MRKKCAEFRRFARIHAACSLFMTKCDRLFCNRGWLNESTASEIETEVDVTKRILFSTSDFFKLGFKFFCFVLHRFYYWYFKCQLVSYNT